MDMPQERKNQSFWFSMRMSSVSSASVLPARARSPPRRMLPSASTVQPAGRFCRASYRSWGRAKNWAVSHRSSVRSPAAFYFRNGP